MSNPHRGEVALVVGSATYTLCYSINALCNLEEKLDKPIAEIIDTLGKKEGKNIKLGLVRSLVWAGLLEKMPDVTPEKAGEIIQEGGVDAVLEKVGEAISIAFPNKEAKAADKNPK